MLNSMDASGSQLDFELEYSNLELCKEYYRYISGHPEFKPLDRKRIRKEVLIEQRIATIPLSGPCEELNIDEFFLTRRGIINLLSEVWRCDALRGSVLLIKGLSLEKFYEAQAIRYSFDFDFVIDSVSALPLLDQYLARANYLLESDEENGAKRRYRKMDGEITVEVNVSGILGTPNFKKQIDWKLLFLGAYTAYCSETPILTPSDPVILLLQIISIHCRSNKELSIRDVCDHVLLLSRIRLSKAEKRLVSEILSDCNCLQEVDRIIAQLHKYKSVLPSDDVSPAMEILGQLNLCTN